MVLDLPERAKERVISRPHRRKAPKTTGKRIATSASVVSRFPVGIAGIDQGIFGPKTPEEFRIHVRRPDDHLVFDLIFENLNVVSEGNAPSKLVRKNANAAAYIIFEFPPQSFGEQAFLEVTAGSKKLDPPPGFK